MASVRTTYYKILSGEFTGTDYTLTLNQVLTENHFVIVFAGDTNSVQPDGVNARVTGDPWSNYATATAANAIQLSRASTGGGADWLGTVLVVESIDDHEITGFRLAEVVEPTMAAPGGNGVQSTVVSLAADHTSQTVPFGAGRVHDQTAENRISYAYTRKQLTSTSDLTVSRDVFAATAGEYTESIYIVEWGSEYTVQVAEIAALATGGDGSSTSHYTTAAISSVVRANTWLVYGAASKAWQPNQNAWNLNVTLGDGVTQNASETTIAAARGIATATRTADLTAYIIEHPSLAVDHVYRALAGGTDISLSETVDATINSETYTSASDLETTAGNRIVLAHYSSSNSDGSTGMAAQNLSVRPTASTTIAMTRQTPPATLDISGWLQSVDFGSVSITAATTATTSGTAHRGRAWVLLDLDLQGRVFRFTNSPETLRVTDAAGRTYAYSPGLDDEDMERRADSTVTDMSAKIIAQQEVSWAKLHARGHSLDRAGAIVRRWVEGDVLERAEIWIRGKTTRPMWGNNTEPFSFGIERLRRESGVIPSDDMLIDTRTWPVTGGFTCDDAALGAWYPMVYGEIPGAVVPGYLVEYASLNTASKVLFAGHRVGATSVTLWDVKAGLSKTQTVQYMDDLLGREIAYVDFVGASFNPTEGTEYRIALDQGGGGYVEAGVTLDGASEIMLSLARRWTDMDVDEGRWAAADPTLNAYRLGLVIVEQVRVWDYIDGEILSLLPVEWTESARGEYPALWRLGATAQDQRGHIDCTTVTGRYDRVSRVGSDSAEIANRFTIQYGIAGSELRPQQSVTVGSGLNLLGVADVSDGTIPNTRCAISERVYGRRPASSIVTEIVHDRQTALLIGGHFALAHALPRRGLMVAGDLSLDSHAINDVVTVTASDVEIESELALVRGKAYEGDDLVTADLLLLDSPLTRTRSTD